MDSKCCTKCQKDLPLSEFYVLKSRNNRLMSRCKACQLKCGRTSYATHIDKTRERQRERARINYARNKIEFPEELKKRNRNKMLQVKYGLDVAIYDEMLQEQNEVCAICNLPADGKGKKGLAVDHSHIDGEIRGLLCSRCNTALERIEFDPHWGNKALEYLERHSSSTTNTTITAEAVVVGGK